MKTFIVEVQRIRDSKYCVDAESEADAERKLFATPTAETQYWLVEDDEYVAGTCVYEDDAVVRDLPDPSAYVEGPPYDAATATGMYDHDDYV